MKTIHKDRDKLIIKQRPKLLPSAWAVDIILTCVLFIFSFYESLTIPPSGYSLTTSEILIIASIIITAYIIWYLRTAMIFIADKTNNVVIIEKSGEKRLNIGLDNIEKIQIKYEKWKWFFYASLDSSRMTSIIFVLKNDQKKVFFTKAESIAEPAIQACQKIADFIDVPFEYINIRDK